MTTSHNTKQAAAVPMVPIAYQVVDWADGATFGSQAGPPQLRS